jgi:hypothetical protein
LVVVVVVVVVVLLQQLLAGSIKSQRATATRHGIFVADEYSVAAHFATVADIWKRDAQRSHAPAFVGDLGDAGPAKQPLQQGRSTIEGPPQAPPTSLKGPKGAC